MSSIKLKFQSIQQMVNAPEVSIICLTDEQESRQLSIVCDSQTAFQLELRVKPEQKNVSFSASNRMLPETLMGIINYLTKLELAVVITNVVDGVYRAVILDAHSGTTFPIKATEGILLTLANKHVPLYAEGTLWQGQSVPYKKGAAGISIPINSLTKEMLQESLDKAIENEDYEVAQHIKEELDRRK